MKTNKIVKVAEQVGASPAAVSKVINHCPGVGNELREQILSAAEEQGICGKKIDSCPVYVILPDIPAFFWRKILDELMCRFSKKNIFAKYNVYSQLGDKKVTEHYLDEAEALDTQIVIIAAKHEGLDTRLAEIAKKRAVFSLLEVTDAPNVFFLGCDRQKDGRLLAEHCMAENPALKSALVLGRDHDRLRGLLDVVGEIDLHTVESTADESAAELARRIDSMYRLSPFDVAICLDGTTAKCSMALKKCKLNIPFYTVEHALIDSRYLIPRGAVCQDLSAIAEKTVCSVENYLKNHILPPSKRIYVSSRYQSADSRSI